MGDCVCASALIIRLTRIPLQRQYNFYLSSAYSLCRRRAAKNRKQNNNNKCSSSSSVAVQAAVAGAEHSLAHAYDTHTGAQLTSSQHSPTLASSHPKAHAARLQQPKGRQVPSNPLAQRAHTLTRALSLTACVLSPHAHCLPACSLPTLTLSPHTHTHCIRNCPHRQAHASALDCACLWHLCLRRCCRRRRRRGIQ